MRSLAGRLSALLIVLSAALSLFAGSNEYGQEENFVVSTNGDKVTITGYKGKAKELKISPRIAGRTVTEIGDCAFMGCTGLTEVTIPDTVTKIGDGAFMSCTGLAKVNIPDTVTKIGAAAFNDCTGLTEVSIPDGVTEIPMSAFMGCTSLRSVSIPKGAEAGYGAFPDGTKVERY